MSALEVKVPDIGDYEDVPVIEVLVKPGDRVAAEDSLVTLESDKATMDVPAPAAGTVRELMVKVGDKVGEGTLILLLDTAEDAEDEPITSASAKQAAPASGNESRAQAAASPSGRNPPAAAAPQDASGDNSRAQATASSSGGKPQAAAAPQEHAVPAPAPDPEAAAAGGETVEVRVPDIGDFDEVPIIEVLVKAGDLVNAEDSLVTLESDKATMDVPSPASGRVRELKAKVGDKVREGSVILILDSGGGATPQPERRAKSSAKGPPEAAAGASAGSAQPAEHAADAARSVSATAGSADPSATAEATAPVSSEGFKAAHASPSVRKFARELGVDLGRVGGSGPKGRILQEDVQKYVKGALDAKAQPAAGGGTVAGAGLSLLPWPKVDFAKFGPIEEKPLSRIKKISGANLARNWVMIPHVTQFDEADITDLEALRVGLNKENEKKSIKVTMLAFLIKASVAALQRFPDFNSALSGDNLVYRKYFHIGFAADTPSGLVVPVIRDADRKGVLAIAKEMGELSTKARDGKLGPADMQGGTFSISSLGGIGGTAFTPIINAPEVAILGVSRGAMKPIWDGKAFAPRLMLPLSLSYDHRVIDGASAARFTTHLAQLLGDMRRALL
ncbi:MAG: dihydrolipoyllysine-residue acetyltransferase [Casimicrobiaceae bacterium]